MKLFAAIRPLLVVLVVFSLALTACQKKEMEVIEQGGLDMAPVIAQVLNPTVGYSGGEILLVLAPKETGHVRITRSNVRVLAVLDISRVWKEPNEKQGKEIESFNYVFDAPADLERHDIKMPTKLGKKIAVSEQAGQLQWFRFSRQQNFLNVEAAFNTDPLTLRKIKYRVLDDGYTIVAESGSRLTMK
ncbi:MAG TPA: hypothetical protein PKW95_17305 [bacterium]|nr:hypothetical protein [bacterium]